ncbi:MAG: dockerin type I repeat-containing protein [Candidatus Glassbacteria bacterium]
MNKTHLFERKLSVRMPAGVRRALGWLLTGAVCQLAVADRAVAQENVLFEEHFDAADWAAHGWYDGPDMLLDPTNRVGTSGSSAVFRWSAAGKTTAESRGGRVQLSPVEGFTISFYIKFSANWAWTRQNFHPHLILFMTDKNGAFEGPAFSHLTLYVEAVDGKPRLGIQDGQNIDQARIGQNLVGITENRAVAGGNGDSDGYPGDYYKNGDVYWNGKDWSPETEFFSDTQGPYNKNDWHQVKAHFQLNSLADGIGVANGVLQFWFDDTLVIDHHDVLFRTGKYPDMKINQFLLLPYYGPGVPHEQGLWIDELKIIQDEQQLPVAPPPVNNPLLFEENFDNADWAANGWYDEPEMITDPAGRMGTIGSSVVFNWTAQGNTTAESRGGRRSIDPVEGLTVSYDIRFSDNWAFAGDTLFPPAFFLFLTNQEGQFSNPVSTHLTVFLDHQDGGLNVGLRDLLNIDLARLGENLVKVTESRAAAGGNGNLDRYPASSFTVGQTVFNLKRIKSNRSYFSDSAGTNYKGDWHHVSAHLQLNGVVDGKGVANGVAQYWYDGQLVMDHKNVLFRTGQYPEMRFNQFLLLPYLSGGAPHQQSVWIDNLQITKDEQELSVPVQLRCDVNNDGRINVIDVIWLILLGRLNPADPRLDWNGDGSYSILDAITLLRNIVGGECP